MSGSLCQAKAPTQRDVLASGAVPNPGVGPTSCLTTGHLDLGLELGLGMVQPIRKLPWQWCGLLAFEPSLGAGGRKVRWEIGCRVLYTI